MVAHCAATQEADRILAVFRGSDALMEGHFKLSSGKHSAVYLQCAKVLQNPARAEELCAELAARVRARALNPELVVSPALGGIIVGYEMGRQLGLDALFTEREQGRMRLRRGFAIPRGARVLMVEDVVTTGKSSRECLATITELGGRPIGAACLIDRSGGRASLDVPLIALAQIDAPLYDPDQLPPELAAIAPVKPGSRPEAK